MITAKRRLQVSEAMKRWRGRNPETAKAYYKAYRERNLDRVRLNQVQHNQNIRAQAVELLGNRCVQCGFSDARALQIDHIEGGGSAERRKIGTSGIVRRVINGEPGYQLLCANCNFIKRCEKEEYGHHM